MAKFEYGRHHCFRCKKLRVRDADSAGHDDHRGWFCSELCLNGQKAWGGEERTPRGVEEIVRGKKDEAKLFPTWAEYRVDSAIRMDTDEILSQAITAPKPMLHSDLVRAIFFTDERVRTRAADKFEVCVGGVFDEEKHAVALERLWTLAGNGLEPEAKWRRDAAALAERIASYRERQPSPKPDFAGEDEEKLTDLLHTVEEWQSKQHRYVRVAETVVPDESLPTVDWRTLTGSGNFVVYVVRGDLLRIVRHDSPTGPWLSAVVRLSQQTTACVKGPNRPWNVIECKQGEEVLVPFGGWHSDLGKKIFSLMRTMFMEKKTSVGIEIRPAGLQERGANMNPERVFTVSRIS